MKYLVTGFPKFDRFAENSTQMLIESMQSDPPEELSGLRDSIAFEMVEFDNKDAASQQKTMRANFRKLLAKHDPSVCLFCGQAASRSWITLETIAINVFKGDLIDPEGPPAYWATLPEQKSLVEALCKAEIPAKLSHHAGTHLCNHILYDGLRHADTHANGMVCGFLHLPMTNSQVISGNENRPFVPLSMTRKALVMAILHTHQHS